MRGSPRLTCTLRCRGGACVVPWVSRGDQAPHRPVGAATWVRGTWQPSAGCRSLGRQLPGVAMWVLGPHHTADAPLKVPTPGTLHSPPRVAMGPETTRERQLVAPLGTAGGWCGRPAFCSSPSLWTAQLWAGFLLADALLPPTILAERSSAKQKQCQGADGNVWSLEGRALWGHKR